MEGGKREQAQWSAITLLTTTRANETKKMCISLFLSPLHI
jgi:hypothetical protein